jgi:hypothetical protein
MPNSTPYDLLVGVGTLYVAAAGTAAPATVETAPGVSWTDVGETDDGVKITKTQNIEMFGSDQRTGKVKAVRTEEGLTIEVSLQKATLENLANALGATVTTVAAGTGTIGTKSMGLYAGAAVTEFALLFRGNSPYGNWAGQFYVPRGVFIDDIEMEYKKDDKVLIPVKFEALENLSAGTEAERFGLYTVKSALAT